MVNDVCSIYLESLNPKRTSICVSNSTSLRCGWWAFYRVVTVNFTLWSIIWLSPSHTVPLLLHILFAFVVSKRLEQEIVSSIIRLHRRYSDVIFPRLCMLCRARFLYTRGYLLGYYPCPTSSVSSVIRSCPYPTVLCDLCQLLTGTRVWSMSL